MKVIIAKIVVVIEIVVWLAAVYALYLQPGQYVWLRDINLLALQITIGLAIFFTMSWAIDTIVVDRNQKRKGK